jgi:hypothetical protein
VNNNRYASVYSFTTNLPTHIFIARSGGAVHSVEILIRKIRHRKG